MQSQKVLRQERVHHTIFGVEMPADLAKEVESLAEYLGRVIGRYFPGLVEQWRAAPVACEVAEVDGEIAPALCLCGNGTQCNHRFVETR